MISLAYLRHIEQIFNSYGLAGLVLAATSLGQALAGPLTSRWMGYWAMRPVIILTIVVSALARPEWLVEIDAIAVIPDAG